MNLIDQLPDNINGWEKATERTIYTPDNLYHYIDGGAELFISYGFNNASSIVFEKKEHPEIRVEIFDMAEDKNAYGVFSLSSEKDDELFGQGSQYIEGSLIFWKGTYFISIMAGLATEESKEAIFEMAEIIDNNITKPGNIPEIVSLLPESELVKKNIIYFNHHAWQNTYYFLSDENIFNIDKNCNAVLTQYKFDDKKCILILIEYTSEKEAEGAHNKFMVNFFDELIDEPFKKMENEKWMVCQRYQNYVYTIFNSINKDNIEKIEESLLHNINQK